MSELKVAEIEELVELLDESYISSIPLENWLSQTVWPISKDANQELKTLAQKVCDKLNWKLVEK